VDDVRSLTLAVMRSAVRHRTTGHAAEMSFFAMLALVPATVAIGGAMHVVARIAGEQTQVREIEGAVSSIRLILGPGLGEQVIVPFVRAQLAQPHGGLAVGSLFVTWWLLSHLFHSTSHALDTVYEVRTHRGTPVRRAIALVYALAAAVAITVTLAVMSAVPLGVTEGPHELVAVSAAQLVWTVARWPLLAVVLVLALTSLYRFSPDVRHSFRQCLSGAVVAVTLWLGLIVGFRYYLALGFGAPTGVISDDPSVILIGRGVGAVVASAFLFYFASSAVLLGAELNAVLLHRARERAVAGSLVATRVAPPSGQASPTPASGAPGPPEQVAGPVAPELVAEVVAPEQVAGAVALPQWAGPGVAALARLRDWRSLTGKPAVGSPDGRSAQVPTPTHGRRVRVVPTHVSAADGEPSSEAGRVSV